MAIEIKDIEKLADLARIKISDGEKEGLRKDLEEILLFVSQIKEVTTGEQVPEAGVLRNVFRDDRAPHDAGIFTEDLLSAACARDGNKVVVKNVL